MKKRHTQVFLGALTKQFFLSFLGIYMFSTLVQAQSFSEIKNIGVSGMPTNANLGWAVDVDGDFAVAAAYRDDIGGTFDAGRIFLFGRDVGGVDNWGLIRIIQASDAAASDRFGTSIEIDGDYIIVGAPDADPAGNSAGGKAYIYYRNEGGTDNWGQQASLTAFDQALSTTPKFGDDVAINGDWAVIGAPQHDQAPGVVDNTGAIYVYQRTGTTWNFVKQIIPADVLALDKFGTAVDIDGDYIVASSPSAGLAAPNGGAFYIFERNLGGSNNWGLIGRRSGSTIVADDALGNDIAISGDNIIVGAHKADDFGTSSGTAYIFSRNTPSANAWGEARQLFASSHRASDQFGWAVDIDGNLA
ncbi:MAG: FG-GAP repeat protein, partial [Saprospiraceae bacterium]|nr:FG-GAP repeat protein [Saprospiraceae bacterium]